MPRRSFLCEISSFIFYPALLFPEHVFSLREREREKSDRAFEISSYRFIPFIPYIALKHVDALPIKTSLQWMFQFSVWRRDYEFVAITLLSHQLSVWITAARFIFYVFISLDEHAIAIASHFASYQYSLSTLIFFNDIIVDSLRSFREQYQVLSLKSKACVYDKLTMLINACIIEILRVIEYSEYVEERGNNAY